MAKTLLISSLILSIFTCSLALCEESFKNELLGGANAFIASETNGGVFGGSNTNDTRISINAAYGYFLDAHWELSTSLDVISQSGNGAYSGITPMIGGAYNFSDNILNSFYLGARIGENFYTSTSSHNYAAPVVGVEIGRRIQLFSQIAWIPRFYVYSRSQATASDSSNWVRGSYLEYSFVPLQLTLLF